MKGVYKVFVSLSIWIVMAIFYAVSVQILIQISL